MPEESWDILFESIADSTKKQYNSVYKSWWEFCASSNIPVYEAQTSQVISFFQNQFNKKLGKYGTFNNYRSALALILPEKTINNACVKRYLKGIARVRPQTKKYNFIWDPQQVLQHIGNLPSNPELDLNSLTRKLVTLLALATAHRLQTLSLIKIKNINISHFGVQIFITDNIKTSKPGSFQPCLSLPYYEENPNLCVATAINTYIEKTIELRSNDQEYLLISTRPPYQRASSQTVGRWVKELLSEAGIDTKIFTPYSTRHASTSAALRRGVSIDLIRKTAGWSENSKTFAKFYNKPLSDKFSYVSSVFKIDEN